MKTLPVPKQHSGTPDQKLGAKYDPASAFKVIGDAILSGSTKLPDRTTEN